MKSTRSSDNYYHSRSDKDLRNSDLESGLNESSLNYTSDNTDSQRHTLDLSDADIAFPRSPLSFIPVIPPLPILPHNKNKAGCLLSGYVSAPEHKSEPVLYLNSMHKKSHQLRRQSTLRDMSSAIRTSIKSPQLSFLTERDKDIIELALTEVNDSQNTAILRIMLTALERSENNSKESREQSQEQYTSMQQQAVDHTNNILQKMEHRIESKLDQAVEGITASNQDAKEFNVAHQLRDARRLKYSFFLTGVSCCLWLINLIINISLPSQNNS